MEQIKITHQGNHLLAETATEKLFCKKINKAKEYTKQIMFLNQKGDTTTVTVEEFKKIKRFFNKQN